MNRKKKEKFVKKVKKLINENERILLERTGDQKKVMLKMTPSNTYILGSQTLSELNESGWNKTESITYVTHKSLGNTEIFTDKGELLYEV